MSDLDHIHAVSSDWETYSPMTHAEVQALIELIANYQNDTQLLWNALAVHCWGIQAALGNWDAPSAVSAVHAFYAREPRAEWTGGGPNDGEPRPVLPADINEFIQRARSAP